MQRQRTCHYCLNLRQTIQPPNYCQCSNRRCSKLYCSDCISNYLDPAFTYSRYKKQTWVCYFCAKTCNCPYCDEGDRLITRRRKKFHTGREVKIEEESNTNLLINETSCKDQGAINTSLLSMSCQNSTNNQGMQEELLEDEKTSNFKLLMNLNDKMSYRKQAVRAFFATQFPQK